MEKKSKDRNAQYLRKQKTPQQNGRGPNRNRQAQQVQNNLISELADEREHVFVSNGYRDPSWKTVNKSYGNDEAYRSKINAMSRQMQQLKDQNGRSFNQLKKKLLQSIGLNQFAHNTGQSVKSAEEDVDSGDIGNMVDLINSYMDFGLTDVGKWAWKAASPSLVPWLKKGTRSLVQKALPIIKDKIGTIKGTDSYQKFADNLQDWTTLNLHDYHPLFQPVILDKGYSNVLQNNGVDNGVSGLFNAQSQYYLEGVSIQAIQCVLNPKSYVSRVPTVEIPMAIISKTVQFPLRTNANGDCIYALHPINIINSDSFITGCKELDFNPQTGTGTQFKINSLYSTLGDTTFNLFQVIGFQVVLRFTTPALTTQGSLVLAMNPSGITYHEYDGGFHSTTNSQLLAQPYVVNSSLSQADGLQVVLEPLSSTDSWAEGRVVNPYGSLQSTQKSVHDQIIILIKGAVANQEIGLIEIKPVIQYQPDQTTSEFIQRDMPPAGVSTLKVLQSIITYDKNILLLGNQEMNAYTSGLATVSPNFNSVIDYTKSYLNSGVRDKMVQNIGTGSYVMTSGSSGGGTSGGGSGGFVNDTLVPPQDDNCPKQNDNNATNKIEPEEDWDVTNKQRNREQHAKNGNINISESLPLLIEYEQVSSEDKEA